MNDKLFEKEMNLRERIFQFELQVEEFMEAHGDNPKDNSKQEAGW